MSQKPISLAEYEKISQEIEQILARLEDPNQSLDDAFKDFEQGVALIKSCQTLLTEAQQKVEIMLQDKTEPFEPAS